MNIMILITAIQNRYTNANAILIILRSDIYIRRRFPGGYSEYILVGVCPGTKKGGVLGAGTAPQKGGLRCGHNQKKGGLRYVYNPKKGEFKLVL